MANKSLFKTIAGAMLPRTDAVNEAGGVAYAMTPEQALAQYAATGCLNGTYYASAAQQLDAVLAAAAQVEPAYIAQVAVYARERGAMKDLPALLCAVLTARDGEMLARVFGRVIDSPKMLRNFVQIVRSGAVGRKSLGSRPKRLVREWLAARSDEQIFFAMVGNAPSLADVIKMVHPRPATESRRALYAYIIGRPYEAEHLPAIVAEYEAFKAGLLWG